jgi:hypothetical protein
MEVRTRVLDKRKQGYDKKHIEVVYQPGELVDIWRKSHKSPNKLIASWHGPFRIRQAVGTSSYKVTNMQDMFPTPLKSDVIHVEHLKKHTSTHDGLGNPLDVADFGDVAEADAVVNLPEAKQNQSEVKRSQSEGKVEESERKLPPERKDQEQLTHSHAHGDQEHDEVVGSETKEREQKYETAQESAPESDRKNETVEAQEGVQTRYKTRRMAKSGVSGAVWEGLKKGDFFVVAVKPDEELWDKRLPVTISEHEHVRMTYCEWLSRSLM